MPASEAAAAKTSPGLRRGALQKDACAHALSFSMTSLLISKFA